MQAQDRMTPQEFNSIVASRYYLAEMSYSTAPSERDISFDTLQTEDITIGCFSGANTSVRRNWRHIRHSASNIYILWLPIEGSLAVTQDGQHAEVESGGLTITSGDRAFSLQTFATKPAKRTRLVHVAVTSRLIRSLLPPVDRLCGRVFEAQTGSARIARDLFCDLLAQRRHLSANSVYTLSLAGLDVLSDTIRSEVADETLYVSIQQRHFEKVDAYIKANFHRRGLTAGDVAQACHMSRRTLFYVMEAKGFTFRDYLRAYRIQQALAWRRDPDYGHCTSRDIAYLAGLSGPAELGDA